MAGSHDLGETWTAPLVSDYGFGSSKYNLGPPPATT